MAVYCSSYAKIYKNSIFVLGCFLRNGALKFDFLAFKSLIVNALTGQTKSKDDPHSSSLPPASLPLLFGKYKSKIEELLRRKIILIPKSISTTLGSNTKTG